MLGFVFSINAAKQKEDLVLNVQKQIDQAYQLGYVDAAPVEMNFIEKKVLTAIEARDKRKKKLFKSMIEEIKADLRIVKKRFEINQLHKKLLVLQQQNELSKRTLDELKAQLQ